MRRPVVVLGLVLILMGLACNIWTIDWLIGSGTVELPAVKWSIRAWAALQIALGIVIILCRGAEAAANLAVLSLTVFVVCPLLAEAALRMSIKLGVKHLADPARYADMMTDDDYWKLSFRKPSDPKATARMPADPVLDGRSR